MNQFLKSVIAASALVVATAASAAPVQVNVVLSPLSAAFTDTPTASSDGSFSLAGYKYGQWTDVAAGEFDASITGGPSFAAYCYDIKVGLDNNGLYNMSYASGSVPGSDYDAVARLFAAAGFNGSKWANDQVTGVESTALQLAIWETKYDSLANFNLGSGNLKFSGFSQQIRDTATSFATQAKALTAGSYNANVLLFSPAPADSSQALVTTVPEPSTYALMAACLGVVGFVARRKKSV